VEQVLNQQGNVFLDLPQGGHLDGDHRQPVEKVSAKAALLHHRGQVLMGGSNDPNLHRHRLVGTGRDDLSIL
jgi:hypothetical protein